MATKRKILQPAHVVTLDDLRQSERTAANPDDPTYRYRILAEGDSWFSIGAIPSSNLLFELQFKDPTIILNLAYPGDTIEHMSSLAANPDLLRLTFNQRFGYEWDLILLSGGGNDIIDQAGVILSRQSVNSSTVVEDYIDAGALNACLKTIRKGYEQVVAIRDKKGGLNRDKPIVLHAYDYAVPRNAPARFLFAGVLGPWLYSVMMQRGVPKPMQIPIAKYLIDKLSETLLGLADKSTGLPNVFVVNTLGTLTPSSPNSTGNSGDWLNEIHPNMQGYRKLAEKMAFEISKHLDESDVL